MLKGSKNLAKNNQKLAAMNESGKLRYRMYKAGKTWLFAGITTFSLGLVFMVSTAPDAHAATEPATSQTVAATDANTSSQTVSETDSETSQTNSDDTLDTNSQTNVASTTQKTTANDVISDDAVITADASSEAPSTSTATVADDRNTTATESDVLVDPSEQQVADAKTKAIADGKNQVEAVAAESTTQANLVQPAADDASYIDESGETQQAQAGDVLQQGTNELDVSGNEGLTTAPAGEASTPDTAGAAFKTNLFGDGLTNSAENSASAGLGSGDQSVNYDGVTKYYDDSPADEKIDQANADTDRSEGEYGSVYGTAVPDGTVGEVGDATAAKNDDLDMTVSSGTYPDNPLTVDELSDQGAISSDSENTTERAATLYTNASSDGVDVSVLGSGQQGANFGVPDNLVDSLKVGTLQVEQQNDVGIIVKNTETGELFQIVNADYGTSSADASNYTVGTKIDGEAVYTAVMNGDWMKTLVSSVTSAISDASQLGGDFGQVLIGSGDSLISDSLRTTISNIVDKLENPGIGSVTIGADLLTASSDAVEFVSDLADYADPTSGKSLGASNLVATLVDLLTALGVDTTDFNELYSAEIAQINAQIDDLNAFGDQLMAEGAKESLLMPATIETDTNGNTIISVLSTESLSTAGAITNMFNSYISGWTTGIGNALDAVFTGNQVFDAQSLQTAAINYQDLANELSESNSADLQAKATDYQKLADQYNDMYQQYKKYDGMSPQDVLNEAMENASGGLLSEVILQVGQPIVEGLLNAASDANTAIIQPAIKQISDFVTNGLGDLISEGIDGAIGGMEQVVAVPIQWTDPAYDDQVNGQNAQPGQFVGETFDTVSRLFNQNQSSSTTIAYQNVDKSQLKALIQKAASTDVNIENANKVANDVNASQYDVDMAVKALGGQIVDQTKVGNLVLNQVTGVTDKATADEALTDAKTVLANALKTTAATSKNGAGENGEVTNGTTTLDLTALSADGFEITAQAAQPTDGTTFVYDYVYNANGANAAAAAVAKLDANTTSYLLADPSVDGTTVKGTITLTRSDATALVTYTVQPADDTGTALTGTDPSSELAGTPGTTVNATSLPATVTVANSDGSSTEWTKPATVTQTIPDATGNVLIPYTKGKTTTDTPTPDTQVDYKIEPVDEDNNSLHDAYDATGEPGEQVDTTVLAGTYTDTAGKTWYKPADAQLASYLVPTTDGGVVQIAYTDEDPATITSTDENEISYGIEAVDEKGNVLGTGTTDLTGQPGETADLTSLENTYTDTNDKTWYKPEAGTFSIPATDGTMVDVLYTDVDLTTGTSTTTSITITDNGDGTWTVNYPDGTTKIVTPGDHTGDTGTTEPGGNGGTFTINPDGTMTFTDADGNTKTVNFDDLDGTGGPITINITNTNDNSGDTGNGVSTDTDKDGIPDDFEATLQTDKDNADTDGDGDTDLQEVLNKTDPLDPNSNLQTLTDGKDTITTNTTTPLIVVVPGQNGENEGITVEKGSDGSVTLNYPDGSSETIKPGDTTEHQTPNGGTFVVNPDGTITFTNPDGTQATIDPSNTPSGTTDPTSTINNIVLPGRDGTDGTNAGDQTFVVEKKTNGDIVLHLPDGTTQTITTGDSGSLPNGSTFVVNDDGTITFTNPDGSTFVLDPSKGQTPATTTGTSGETDTDGDGIPDSFEDKIGTDGDNVDTDGDGDTDFQELLNGTDPKDPADNLAAIKNGTSHTGDTNVTVIVNPTDGSGTGNITVNKGDDGSYTLTFSDGSTQTVAPGDSGTTPDGTTFVVNPDGTITFTNTDGETFTVDPNGSTTTGASNQDTDKDGIPDAFEETLGTDATNNDTDGDGDTDLQEVLNGTDPLDASSNFDTAKVKTTDTKPIVVVVPGQGGAQITVEKGSNGSLTLHFPDGTSETIQPNDTTAHDNPAGGTFVVNPDGTITFTNPDGTTYTIDPTNDTGHETASTSKTTVVVIPGANGTDGKDAADQIVTVEKTDEGDIILHLPDGSTATVEPGDSGDIPNGGSYVVNDDGTITFTDPDGSTFTIDPDNGTTPATITINTSGANGTDTDGDGIKDDFEKTLGTDATKADTDGDGDTDLQELLNGTDPKDADSNKDTINDNDANGTNSNNNNSFNTTNIFGTGGDGSLVTTVVLPADANGDSSSILLSKQPDGTLTITMPDGTTKTVEPGDTGTLPNGGTYVVNDDGTVTLTNPDGSTYTIDPGEGNTNTTNNGGVTIINNYFGDGQAADHTDGGKYTTILIPGQTGQDGQTVVVEKTPAGQIILTLPDGTTKTVDSGDTGTLPDGTTYVVNDDGTLTFTSPTGNTYNVDPSKGLQSNGNGNVTNSNNTTNNYYGTNGTKVTEVVLPAGTDGQAATVTVTQQPGGTLTITFPDGTKKNVVSGDTGDLPNGGSYIVNADGTITITNPDGSTTTIDPSRGGDVAGDIYITNNYYGDEGSQGQKTVVVIPGDNGQTTTLNVTKNPDGSLTIVTSDGSKDVKPGDAGTLPDGTTYVVNDDGTITFTSPNKVTFVIDPSKGASNGNNVVVNVYVNGDADTQGTIGSYNVTENTDGSLTLTFPDGSTKDVKPGDTGDVPGGGTYKVTDNNIVITLPGGGSFTINFIQKSTTTTTPGGGTTTPGGGTTTTPGGGTTTTPGGETTPTPGGGTTTTPGGGTTVTPSGETTPTTGNTITNTGGDTTNETTTGTDDALDADGGGDGTASINGEDTLSGNDESGQSGDALADATVGESPVTTQGDTLSDTSAGTTGNTVKGSHVADTTSNNQALPQTSETEADGWAGLGLLGAVLSLFGLAGAEKRRKKS